MKYKVGDRVVLKKGGPARWTRSAEVDLNNLLDHIATIDVAREGKNGLEVYYMKEIGWPWFEHEIECLAPPEKVFEPIENRWEILDIREE